MKARLLSTLLVAAAGSFGSSAHAMDEDLARRSPFLPVFSVDAPQELTGPVPLEFRGIRTDPEMKFSILETSKKSATWLALKERGPGFVVRSYELVGGQHQVVVEHQGRSLVLALKMPKIAAASPLAVAGPRIQSPGGLPRPVAPTLDQTAALKEIAARVEARRQGRLSLKGPQPQPTR